MTAGTKFTKIWRMKNVGNIAWPAGARLLHVAGDQMDAPQSVLASATAVQPGQEIDIAMDMVAPTELGRYMGYFRLTGAQGRRRFGQRVWCHIQVVDESTPVMPPNSVEVEALFHAPRGEATDGEEMEDAPVGIPVVQGAEPAAAPPVTDVEGIAEESAAQESPAPEGAIVHKQDLSSLAGHLEAATAAVSLDDAPKSSPGSHCSSAAELVLDKEELDKQMAMEEEALGDGTDQDDGKSLEAVRAELGSMGFTDNALVDVVLAKHGARLEECARELASLSEWDVLLDDLEEMGFADRARNRQLLVQHSGSLKKTVKELVATDAK